MSPGNDTMTTFDQFWVHYLREHSRPLTRWLHFGGTVLGIVSLVAGLAVGNLWFILAAPVIGYLFSWYSHFFVEKNRPASFEHPFWSFMADFKMGYLIVRGQLRKEISKHRLG